MAALSKSEALAFRQARLLQGNAGLSTEPNYLSEKRLAAVILRASQSATRILDGTVKEGLAELVLRESESKP